MYSEDSAESSSGDASGREFIIQAGWRLEEIAEALEHADMADRDRFLDLVQSRAGSRWLGAEVATPPSLEGYLLPGVYAVPPNATEVEIIYLLLDTFEQLVTPSIQQRAAVTGLSIHEVLTLASIVEREVVHYSEAPVIAGVYLNRLRLGMALQADPTVAYAIDSRRGGDAGAYWESEISLDDLASPSPYNTYAQAGLPPGPIASPSEQAIMSVLYPAASQYLYFVATGSDTHAFSATFEEHEVNVQGGPAAEQTTLQGLIERVIEPVGGHVGVVVHNLQSGETASINPDDMFSSASLYKLGVMVTAFELQEQHQISFDGSLAISEDAFSRDAPAVRARLGARPTVRHAIEEMIVVSSNAAGETLLELLGRHKVEETLREMGLADTWVSTQRLITTPRDVGQLLQLIAEGEATNEQASSEMLSILLRQEINDRLPKLLPAGTAIAHKTGSLDFASHDAGILFTSQGPVVIVVMMEDAPDGALATESISRIGEAIYHHYESYIGAADELQRQGNHACLRNSYESSSQGALSGKTVVLDPGHGGSESGAVSYDDGGSELAEKDVTLDVAMRLQNMLSNAGAITVLTRCRDASVSLMSRAAFANSVEPDLFISIHTNGSEDASRNGTELYYFSQEGEVAANYLLGSFMQPALHHALGSASPLPNGGVRRVPYTVLMHSSAPSVLVEAVYHSNPKEAAMLQDTGPDSRRQQIAEGLMDGITTYFSTR